MPGVSAWSGRPRSPHGPTAAGRPAAGTPRCLRSRRTRDRRRASRGMRRARRKRCPSAACRARRPRSAAPARRPAACDRPCCACAQRGARELDLDAIARAQRTGRKRARPARRSRDGWPTATASSCSAWMKPRTSPAARRCQSADPTSCRCSARSAWRRCHDVRASGLSRPWRRATSFCSQRRSANAHRHADRLAHQQLAPSCAWRGRGGGRTCSGPRSRARTGSRSPARRRGAGSARETRAPPAGRRNRWPPASVAKPTSRARPCGRCPRSSARGPAATASAPSAAAGPRPAPAAARPRARRPPCRPATAGSAASTSAPRAAAGAPARRACRRAARPARPRSGSKPAPHHHARQAKRAHRARACRWRVSLAWSRVDSLRRSPRASRTWDCGV